VRVMPVRLRGRWAGEYDTCVRHSTLHGGATASALEAVGILATVAAGVSAARTVEMSVQVIAPRPPPHCQLG
jgi:acyl-coenzyme A thioesterase PaaI-like protein